MKTNTRVKFLLSFLIVVSTSTVYSQQILFQENFEDSTSNWWNTTEGFNVINEDGNGLLQSDADSEIDFGENSWIDYRYSVHAKLINGWFWLKIRMNSQGVYALAMSETNVEFSRITWDGSADTIFSLVDFDIGLDKWHIYEIEVLGNHIKVFIDNDLIFNIYDDDPIQNGLVGFCSKDGKTCYDNFLVETDRVIPVQEYPWIHTNGPIGGMGYDVRIHPTDHDIMFTTDVWSGLHKSYNKGENWHPRNDGIDLRSTPTRENKFGPSGDAIPVFCVTIDPNDPNIVWSGTQGYRGVFKSVDGGESWTEKTEGIPDDYFEITFRSFAVDPSNSDIVYLATEVGYEEEIWPGAIRQPVTGEIYKTVDGGNNWTRIHESDALIRIILIDPRNPDVLFASSGIFDRNSIKEEGIWKSEDGGITWYHANNGIDIKAMTIGGLDMNPQNPDVMYASTGRSDGFNFDGTVNNAENSEGAIYRTDDGGKTWIPTLTRSPGSTFVGMFVSISPSDPAIVYVGVAGDDEAGMGNAILRTMDGGETWNVFDLATPGTRAGIPVSVAVHPVQSNVVFANYYGGGVVKSKDFGETWMIWSNGYTGDQTIDLTMDANNPNILYVTGQGGPFKSYNGGDDWIGIGYGDAKDIPDWWAIEMNPENSNSVLLGRGMQYEIMKTIDGGSDWNVILRLDPVEENDMGKVSSISWSESDANIVFCSFQFVDNSEMFTDSAGSGTFKASSLGIYKSTDAGKTWSEANKGLEETKKNVFLVEVHPLNSDIVFASVLEEGIYKSTDGGENWVNVNNGLSNNKIHAIAFDPMAENTMYVGLQEGGIFKSMDLGESWEQTTLGMDPEASISSIVVNPANNLEIYAHDWSTGIYSSNDGGDTWWLINSGITTKAGRSLAISNDGELLYAGTWGGGVFRLPLTNFKPNIFETNPDTSEVIRIKKGDSLIFEVEAYDLNKDSLAYSWKLNSADMEIQVSEELNFKSDTLDLGLYSLQSFVADNNNSLTVRWNIEVYECAAITNTEYISICVGEEYLGWAESGEYSRTINLQNGCDSLINTVLTVDKIPPPDLLIDGNTLRIDETFSSYQWYNESGIIQGATTATYVVENSGTYHLEITNEKGCTAITEGREVFLTGFNGLGKTNQHIILSPNPGNGVFRLKISNSNHKQFQVQIFNELGQVQMNRNIHVTGDYYEEVFNISHLSKGIYLLQVFDGKYMSTRRLVLQ